MILSRVSHFLILVPICECVENKSFKLTWSVRFQTCFLVYSAPNSSWKGIHMHVVTITPIDPNKPTDLKRNGTLLLNYYVDKLKHKVRAYWFGRGKLTACIYTVSARYLCRFHVYIVYDRRVLHFQVYIYGTSTFWSFIFRWPCYLHVLISQ